MPADRAAWGAYNYLVAHDGMPNVRPTVTLYPNRLQSLSASIPDVFVTINPFREPDADKIIIDRFLVHPVIGSRHRRRAAEARRLAGQAPDLVLRKLSARTVRSRAGLSLRRRHRGTAGGCRGCRVLEARSRNIREPGRLRQFSARSPDVRRSRRPRSRGGPTGGAALPGRRGNDAVSAGRPSGRPLHHQTRRNRHIAARSGRPADQADDSRRQRGGRRDESARSQSALDPCGRGQAHLGLFRQFRTISDAAVGLPPGCVRRDGLLPA